ncbi:MAG: hypothetical protein NTW04_00160, partial [Elusimicrobia bacterium]|nr:hypothetical protein [Elusimicrobiota bacterium]
RGYLQNNFPAFDGLLRYGHYTRHAHSQPLQMAAETGVLGGILFLAAGLWGFVRKPKNFLALKSAVMFSAVFVHSFVDGIMILPAISIMFFGLLACVSENEEPKPVANSNAFLWLCVFAIISGGITQYALNVFRSAKTENAIKSALKITPQDSALYTELARLSLVKSPPNPFAALDYLNRAIELNPTNAVYRLQKYKILDALGLWRQAEKELERALSFEPFSPRLLSEAVGFYTRQKNPLAVAVYSTRLKFAVDGIKDRKPKSIYEAILINHA